MTLLESEIPAHSHALRCATPGAANRQAPVRNAIARSRAARRLPAAAGRTSPTLAPEALAPAGGDQPHNNLQPYLTFYFCIALQGVFPPRT